MNTPEGRRRETIGGLAALGPLFALDTHPPSSPVAEPWRPMRELVTDPAVLRERVAGVRGYLAAAGGRAPEAVPLRAAASVTQLGLVARLISPVLALAVTTGQVLDFDLARLRWQPVLGNAFPLSVSAAVIDNPGARDRKPEQVATTLARRVLDGAVRETVEATRPLAVSARILWGNAASAVHGAASVIATALPGQAERSQSLVSTLLRLPPLRGTGIRTPQGAFRRRSCCLIYQAAPGASGRVCGDCVLLDRRAEKAPKF